MKYYYYSRRTTKQDLSHIYIIIFWPIRASINKQQKIFADNSFGSLLYICTECLIYVATCVKAKQINNTSGCAHRKRRYLALAGNTTNTLVNCTRQSSAKENVVNGSFASRCYVQKHARLWLNIILEGFRAKQLRNGMKISFLT